MLSVSSAAIGYAPVTAPVRQPRADVRMETMSDLDALAQKLNPKVGFYDPRPDPDPHPSPGRSPSSSPIPTLALALALALSLAPTLALALALTLTRRLRACEGAA